MHCFDQSWPHMTASLFLKSYTQFFQNYKFPTLSQSFGSMLESERLGGNFPVGSWDAAGAQVFSFQNGSNPDFI